MKPWPVELGGPPRHLDPVEVAQLVRDSCDAWTEIPELTGSSLALARGVALTAEAMLLLDGIPLELGPVRAWREADVINVTREDRTVDGGAVGVLRLGDFAKHMRITAVVELLSRWREGVTTSALVDLGAPCRTI